MTDEEKKALPLLFDLGSDASNLRPGFTRVTTETVYTAINGFGWISPKGLWQQHKRHREWIYNEARGTEQPPPIYTNEITEDAILGDLPGVFRATVPPGEYDVHTISGVSDGPQSRVFDFFIQVKGQRQHVIIPGPHRFEHLSIPVEADEGFVDIALDPRNFWVLNAILLIPQVGGERTRRILDRLLDEIYFLPPDVAEKWKEEEEPEYSPPNPTQGQISRGYMVHHRHYLEVVYPHTTPGPEVSQLKIFASLGEYEPATFCVYPLKDLRECEISVSQLRGPGIIPASEIEVRKVRYVYARPNYNEFFSYHVVPDILDRYVPADLKSGINHRFWLTVHVPEDAAPGTYEGEVSIQPANAPKATISLRLEVLPIRLEEDPDRIYAIYYHNPLSLARISEDQISREYWRRKTVLELEDMARHGTKNFTTSIPTSVSVEGEISFDFDAFQEEMDLRDKMGFDSPIVLSIPTGTLYRRYVGEPYGSHLRNVRYPPRGFFDEMTDLVRRIEEERAKRGWPEFLYYPVDEPSTDPEAVRFMVGVLKSIKVVPNVRTYVTADPTKPEFEPMKPYVDVWCTQPFLPDYETVTRDMETGTVEYWCYPNHVNGENDHTPVRGARMTYGFGFWRSGFKALIPWIYQANFGDPFNYLDGPYMDFFNRSEPDGTPVPVILWEAYREGYDDYRYIYTLKRMIERCKGAGGQAAQLAKEASELLRRIWDSINVQHKYKYDGMWSPDTFDRYRLQIAKAIVSLQSQVPK